MYGWKKYSKEYEQRNIYIIDKLTEYKLNIYKILKGFAIPEANTYQGVQ